MITSGGMLSFVRYFFYDDIWKELARGTLTHANQRRKFRALGTPHLAVNRVGRRLHVKMPVSSGKGAPKLNRNSGAFGRQYHWLTSSPFLEVPYGGLSTPHTTILRRSENRVENI